MDKPVTLRFSQTPKKKRRDSLSNQQTAIALFCRGSASDLLGVGRGSVNYSVADPRQNIGKSPINLRFSNMHRSASRSRESETNSYRSAAVCLMAACFGFKLKLVARARKKRRFQSRSKLRGYCDTLLIQSEFCCCFCVLIVKTI